jgi:acyl-CoA thioester hydrolase
LNQPKVFETRIEIRFNDIDAAGHVNNAVIATYFEEGRKVLFYTTFRESVPGGFNFMVAHLECDFVRPVRLKDRLLLKMWVSAIGTKSFELSYLLVDENDQERVFAHGSSVQVCYDYAAGRTMAVPENLKNALAGYRGPARTTL